MSRRQNESDPSAAAVFGQRVRAARLELGWTQDRLAAIAGLGISRIVQVELGRGTSPSIDTARHLSRVLGQPFSQMITD
jgi:transcriptional regulator with XRE-family HTH domain